MAEIILPDVNGCFSFCFVSIYKIIHHTRWITAAGPRAITHQPYGHWEDKAASMCIIYYIYMNAYIKNIIKYFPNTLNFSRYSQGKDYTECDTREAVDINKSKHVLTV